MKSYSTREDALDAMTRALGNALANWQSVEMSLFSLYRDLCGKTDKRISSALFSAMSLETKMVALAALIKVRTDDKKYMQDWDSVSKEFFKQKRVRDKMAHWSVMQSNAMKDGKFVPTEFIAFLAPPLSDIPRMIKVPADPENSEAISAEVLSKHSLNDFGAVNEKIDVFRRGLPNASA
jgi:hypothetical protein